MSALSLADMRQPTDPPPTLVQPPTIATEPPGQSVDPPSETGGRGSGPSMRAPQQPVVEMRNRFSLGDFTGALTIAEQIQSKEPAHPEAVRMVEECQKILVKMYAARIGPMDRVPTVMVHPHELRWLSIDHRAGFLLSLVDGMSTIDMILDMSGMPPLDALRILHELYQQRVISFRA